MIERSVSNNRSPPEKNQVDPKPINNLRFREKLSFIYFLRIWRHEAGHRVVELWSKKYSTVPSYGYKRIKVYCQFICLIWNSKIVIFGFSFDCDAFTSIQWAVRLPSFRHGNPILWQNKASVVAWQQLSHFRFFGGWHISTTNIMWWT